MPAWYENGPCENDVAVQLVEIQQRATQANEPYAAWLASRCSAHPAEGRRPADGSFMSIQDHCAHVNNAHTAAVAGQWQACIIELEHLGSGGGGETLSGGSNDDEAPGAGGA